MSEPAKILLCECNRGGALRTEERELAKDTLCKSGTPFEIVSDLCTLAARKDSFLKRFAAGGPAVIAACYPRAVRWLFRAAGARLPDETEIINLRDEGGADRISIDVDAAPKACCCGPADSDGDNDWVPWFPVIVYDRCTNCAQCASFCLFNVFAMDEDKKVVVRNPANCKTNCPACARICPEVAIIFPQYASAPVNGSDEIPEGTGEAVRVDLKSLLGGDVYKALRQRGRRPKKRFGSLADMAKASKERKARSFDRNLLEELGVPEEIMKNLCGSETKPGPCCSEDSPNSKGKCCGD